MLDRELLSRFPNANVYDVTNFYSDFAAFTINSLYPIHRWYRFKEGYSKDLVNLIVGSLPLKIQTCLDTFAGSGTTPLVSQEIGIQCHSFEVNPFIHHIAKVKLRRQYNTRIFDESIRLINDFFELSLTCHPQIPKMSTITQAENTKKWLFSKDVLNGILALRGCFERLDPIYSDLFLVILASILPQIGNTIKDGKCVRYKKNWRNIKFTSADVKSAFIERSEIFRQDIAKSERLAYSTDNADICKKTGAISALPSLPDNHFDAIITSPPYLNSFDYTDVYMPELWSLGFVQSYEDVRRIRESTLRSHVQVKWETNPQQVPSELNKLIDGLTQQNLELWNSGIPDMIRGYFIDMGEVLRGYQRILRPGGIACIVVGTSSYYGITIPTDLLIASQAEQIGLELREIRIIRNFQRSSNQIALSDGSLPPLRESIIMLQK